MLDVNEKETVRRAVLVDEKSQRQVACETGHSRNTIRRLLADGEVPRYRLKQARACPVLGPFKSVLEAWVAEDEQKPKKKRRTAQRMYQLLRGEDYGYRGAESSVRAYVGQVRKKARHKVYLPLEYAPGEVAQVDFGEADVIIAGEPVVAQLFVMWLGHSSATFVKAYPGQAQEVFFDGHLSGFDFWGGTPRQIWYDNLKLAVRKVLQGAHRQEQQAFIAFRSHYLFEAHFCNVRAGWEKGGVEGRVGYTRRNWLIPVREFPSWAALNQYLRAQCQAEWGRRLSGRDQTIGQLLAMERAALRPLPERAFPCGTTVPVQPNHLALVSFATNRYSVPTTHAHERLLLHAYPDHIEIANGSATVARHARCWGREQDILEPRHYLALLERRPRALEQAKPIRRWRESWPQAFETYLAALKQRQPGTESTPLFVRILRLCEDHPESVVAEALHQALAAHCYTYDGVRELLRRVAQPAPPPAADLSARPRLAAVHVSPPNLSQFNQLLAQGGAA
jgi:transposase